MFSIAVNQPEDDRTSIHRFLDVYLATETVKQKVSVFMRSKNRGQVGTVGKSEQIHDYTSPIHHLLMYFITFNNDFISSDTNRIFIPL